MIYNVSPTGILRQFHEVLHKMRSSRDTPTLRKIYTVTKIMFL